MKDKYFINIPAVAGAANADGVCGGDVDGVGDSVGDGFCGEISDDGGEISPPSGDDFAGRPERLSAEAKIFKNAKSDYVSDICASAGVPASEAPATPAAVADGATSTSAAKSAAPATASAANADGATAANADSTAANADAVDKSATADSSATTAADADSSATTAANAAAVIDPARPLLLAIESSCDDSSVAIIDLRSLACVFYETLAQGGHAAAGGVVPELASRLHTAALPHILARAAPHFERVGAVAATAEPGLAVSLQSGVACAKALAAALRAPFYAVNHLKGHICSLFLESAPPERFLCLLVSGGHTQIIRVNRGQLGICAATSDDSLGESFDKTAKMLDGPYPGGPWVSERAAGFERAVAAGGLAQARQMLGAQEFERFFGYEFSVPLRRFKERAEYSFSGLKNQVRLRAQMTMPQGFEELARGKICYEFERAAVAHIIDKLRPFLLAEAAECQAAAKPCVLGIVGGASANARLRSALAAECAEIGAQLLLAPLEFCSDNARMIARAAVFKHQRGETSELVAAVIHPRSSEFARL